MKNNQDKSSHGGARPNAGRKPGARNRRTTAAIDAAKAAGLLPHEFLLAVSRGEMVDDYKPTFAERMAAAKDAAPYFAPKLANIEANVSINDHEQALDELE